MEYRGVEYAVVRTITRRWRWSVKRDHNDKVGTAEMRMGAIGFAQRFIDELVRNRARQLREHADKS
jgi:hypothetical protein